MVIIGSIFRDAEQYVPRYFEQIDRLRDVVDDVRLVICEGDSDDDTFDALADRITASDYLIKFDHGGPKYGSVDNPDRWRQLAQVCNVVMGSIASRVKDDDSVIYVESDLIWTADTFTQLLEDLNFVGAVAPMSIYGKTNGWYETWGATKDGVAFTPDPPYHPSLDGEPDFVLTPIDTMGSCIATRGAFARSARFSPVDCIRGYSRDLARLAGGLFLDRTVAVFHP